LFALSLIFIAREVPILSCQEKGKGIYVPKFVPAGGSPFLRALKFSLKSLDCGDITGARRIEIRRKECGLKYLIRVCIENNNSSVPYPVHYCALLYGKI